MDNSKKSKSSYLKLNVKELIEAYGHVLDTKTIQKVYKESSSDMFIAVKRLDELSGTTSEYSIMPEQQDDAEQKAEQYLCQLEEKKGDLFSANPEDSLAHCVSRCLAMGKGIAVHFKEQFGGVDDLRKQDKQIGETAVLKRDNRFIYYLITKERYL
jgi:hypothetical protein